MKKTLPLFFFFITTIGLSQNMPRGLADFQVNATTNNDIIAYASTKGVVIEKINSFSVLRKLETKLGTKKMGIAELIYDPAGSGPVQASQCSEARVYQVFNYTINDIPITDLILTFYQDTLIDIHCNSSSEIREILKTKYPEHKDTLIKKPVNCVYKLTGVSAEYEDISIELVWKSDGNFAMDVLRSYYDSKCQPEAYHILVISDSEKSRIKSGCELEGMQKKRDAEKAKAMQKANGF